MNPRPAPRSFPFFSHRTLAEVAETEEWRAMKRCCKGRRGYNWRRLDALLGMEEANNPLPDPKSDIVA